MKRCPSFNTPYPHKTKWYEEYLFLNVIKSLAIVIVTKKMKHQFTEINYTIYHKISSLAL